MHDRPIPPEAGQGCVGPVGHRSLAAVLTTEQEWVTGTIAGHHHLLVSASQAVVSLPCVGALNNDFHMEAFMVRTDPPLRHAPLAMIITQPDEAWRFTSKLRFCEGISPDEALHLIQGWIAVLNGPSQVILNRDPGRPPTVDIDAYITALRNAYFDLRERRDTGSRAPSHTQCARLAGQVIDGKPLRLDASKQRLRRAEPPTSWEKLVRQWEIQAKEAGQNTK